MDISLHHWPTSKRPCRFSLSLQSDSVFADFDTDDDGRVYLCRISFDGFGCCSPENGIPRLPESESQILLRAVENGAIDQDPIRRILFQYFRETQNHVWHDALRHHGLLSKHDC